MHVPLRRFRLSRLALALALVLLGACGAADSGSQPTTAPAAAPAAALTLQLHWLHDYSSVGFYAAEKNGHYAGQNLQVTIAGGGFNDQGYIDATAQVASGKADFGIASADSIIRARAEGRPVVGIAAIFQRSPLAILSLGDSSIQTPQDLPGKKILVADGGATQLYRTLLSLHKIDEAKAPPLPRTASGIAPLVNGEVDAMVAWAINEGVEMKEAGKTPNVMLMSDYGIDSYELVLLTSEKMIAERPEVVTRFLRATLQGWNDVVSNPDASVALVQAYNSELKLDGQRSRLQATLPLLTLPGTKFGTMQPEFWTFTHQMLLDQKALSAPIDLPSAYTLRFLEAAATP